MARGERSYHHGNLREALIRAALDLLEEGGPEAVGLRATARRAGVSHAAPYHYFPDKARLVEALATRGFEDFADALGTAWTATAGNSLEKLRATGIAYVVYAVERPGLFRLMNRPELRRGDDDEPGSVERAAQGSYAVLRDGIRACQEEGLVEPGDAEPYALAAWSLVHGVAVLSIDGLIRGRPTTLEEATRIAGAVTGVLGGGLLRR